MNPAEFPLLMHRLLDGENLSGEEFAAIESELLINAELRREWKKLASLHSALEVNYASQTTLSEAKVVPIERILARQHARTARIALMAAAAVVFISAFTLWMILAPQSSTAVATMQVAPNSVYSLVHADPRSKVKSGDLEKGSLLALHHGVAKLDLPHDVRAVFRAPAQVILLDARTLRLDHGSAYFEVTSEAGQGFTVVTPHQRIVDLGTAFGIDTREDRSEVALHVIEGEVRVDSLDGVPGEILTAPRAVTLNGAAITRELDVTGSGFMRSLPEKVEPLLVEDFESGLRPGTDYAVLIDPALILDAAGNAFAGFGDNTRWTFRTGLPSAVEVKNPGFEENERRVNYGEPIAHWESVTLNEWGWGVDTQRENLGPSRGAYFGRLFGGNAIAQSLDTPITAGTTYVLTLDVAVMSDSSAVVRFFGSGQGHQAPLGETTASSSQHRWVHDRSMHYTATEADATGQTLGIELRCVNGTAMFDHIRLQAFGPDEKPGIAPQPEFAEAVPVGAEASTAPVLLARHPAEGAQDFDPNTPLTLTFDRPIRLSTGRVILRNIDEWSESVIISSSRRLVANGPVLEIYPPSNLGDGATSLGVLPGWELAAPAGLHNPADSVFNHPKGKRRVNHMATVAAGAAGNGIRREIGVIKPDRHYTASLAIGHRKTGDFPGYHIRFLSGDVVLAERAAHTPPGTPGSVETVGLSWNAADLPAGVAPGDPLVLEIAPARASAHGVLDIENVRVTAVSARL